METTFHERYKKQPYLVSPFKHSLKDINVNGICLLQWTKNRLDYTITTTTSNTHCQQTRKNRNKNKRNENKNKQTYEEEHSTKNIFLRKNVENVSSRNVETNLLPCIGFVGWAKRKTIVNRQVEFTLLGMEYWQYEHEKNCVYYK